MWFVCTLAAASVVSTLSTPIRKYDHSTDLAKPNQKLKNDIFVGEPARRVGLAASGPFSLIPADEFTLDDGTHKRKTIKKDLSQTTPQQTSRKDLKSCLRFVYEYDIPELEIMKKSYGAVDEDLINAICKKYADRMTPEPERNGVGNLAVAGLGGIAGNVGLGGQGSTAGNLAVDGKGGVAGNVGVGGKGGLAGNIGINGQGGLANNVLVSGGGASANYESKGDLGNADVDGLVKGLTETFLAGLGGAAIHAVTDGLESYGGSAGNAGIHGQAAIAGDVGFHGQGGIAGDTMFHGQGGETWNDGTHGQGGITGQNGIAGDAWFHGQGGVPGNTGLHGQGGLAGNAGLNGQGGISGNLGLNGQGTIAGDIGFHGQGGIAEDAVFHGQGGIAGDTGFHGQHGIAGDAWFHGQSGFAGNADLNGQGGIAGNLGLNGQGGLAGNAGLNGKGGVAGNAVMNGQGGVAGGIGFHGQGGIAEDAVFHGQGGIDGDAWFHGQSGLAGNAGQNGQGGIAGNLGLNGQGGLAGNTGLNGKGGVAGNAGMNGQGGVAGNLGVAGIGEQAGNLGVGGTGGLFGNMGIGGQGGLFGNVGIGGIGGNHHGDRYHSNRGFQPNFLAQATGQNGRNVNLLLNQGSTSNRLNQILKSPKEFALKVSVSSLNNELGSFNTASQDAVSVGASNLELLGLKQLELNARETKVNRTASGSQTPNIVARFGETTQRKLGGHQHNLQCVVGALAYGGVGGQVGNLAVSRASQAPVQTRCENCLHVLVLTPNGDKDQSPLGDGVAEMLSPLALMKVAYAPGQKHRSRNENNHRVMKNIPEQKKKIDNKRLHKFAKSKKQWSH